MKWIAAQLNVIAVTGIRYPVPRVYSLLCDDKYLISAPVSKLEMYNQIYFILVFVVVEHLVF